MKTRSILTSALMSVMLLTMNLVSMDLGFAQGTEGRWVLGFHGGGNVWFNDYNTRMVGIGGEAMLRYGISKAFSAGLLAGYEELKSEQKPPLPGQGYLKLHAIPASATLWVHFASGKKFNPYVYAGFGAMIYKRLNGAGVYIPDSEFITSILVPVGAGFEVFASKKTSFVVDVGYRVTDDYTDVIKMGKLGGYATAKVGVNWYFGTSVDDEEAQALREAQARRLQELADAEARRVKELADAEARRLKELADAKARQLKELADAEARRLAEQKGRDTLIILEKGKTVILRGVNFEFNKATLTKFSENILEKALSALNISSDLNVLIVGHTDNVGSAVYNNKLSLRRAESVKAWLVGRGISAKRLTVGGKGFDEPVDDNTTAEGRLNNRRIEFRVLE